MHQPYYKDNLSNTTLMPWVFLHAIKDYYDIPWYMEKFPSIKATFNLVPSLMLQIDEYINGKANDKLIDIIRKDVKSLKIEELRFLEEFLFLSNEKNMIKPFHRYYELFLKFKADGNSLVNFSYEEITEVQTLFLLSWCGNYLRESSNLVKDLIKQEKDYSNEQKYQLINELYDFLPQIISYYKKLVEKNQIAISTTPFYHPILPLLINRNSAKEAKVDVTLPASFENYENYAKLQVEYAVEYFKNKFEYAPIGFWPSEGSVSVPTVELLSSNGVKWLATDEEILFKSLNNSNKEVLYKPYCLNTPHGETNLFFRDKYLSDLIGFEYSKKEPKEAAQDFISHLKNIYLNSKESPLVSVILDGENAWEFYKNNAKEFFEHLYTLLEEQSWCETILFEDIDKIEELNKHTLNSLASGSWINGNFDIWIGNNEKNKAWELLDLTKNAFESTKEDLDEIQIKKIENEFLIALGSDWFWWYGDDHYTELNHQFDEQFRAHLKNIYLLMDKEIPTEIFTPIVKKTKKHSSHIKPTDFITPTVDGNMSNFFEWLNSGFVDIKKEFSTMDSSSCIIDSLYYGKDKTNNLYLYLKGKKLETLDDSINLNIILDEQEFYFMIQKGSNSIILNNINFNLAFDKGIEIEVIDYSKEKIRFSFELIIDGKKVQKFPLYDDIILDFENFNLISWYI
jgi:alpha-amylase/alpha-mannosidase (GH57 family)